MVTLVGLKLSILGLLIAPFIPLVAVWFVNNAFRRLSVIGAGAGRHHRRSFDTAFPPEKSK
ncbi:MAG TPA: hypothetical protein VLY24_02455 [Bryobacteraceae bacterium]|nr:hypothetical protein [Bryobacteraceae bacterium]